MRSIAERSYRQRFRNAVQLGESRLWEVLELGREAPHELDRELRRLEAGGLFALYWSHGSATRYVYQAGLREHMGPHTNDWSLIWLAGWIVDQGQAYWNSVLDDVSVAPRRLAREDEGGGIRELIAEIYRDRFGEEMPWC